MTIRKEHDLSKGIQIKKCLNRLHEKKKRCNLGQIQQTSFQFVKIILEHQGFT